MNLMFPVPPSEPSRDKERSAFSGSRAGVHLCGSPARLPSAHKVVVLMLDLMNRTEPSAISTLTPPECRLLAVNAPPLWALVVLPQQLPYPQLTEFGGMT